MNEYFHYPSDNFLDSWSKDHLYQIWWHFNYVACENSQYFHLNKRRPCQLSWRDGLSCLMFRLSQYITSHYPFCQGNHINTSEAKRLFLLREMSPSGQMTIFLYILRKPSQVHTSSFVSTHRSLRYSLTVWWLRCWFWLAVIAKLFQPNCFKNPTDKFFKVWTEDHPGQTGWKHIFAYHKMMQTFLCFLRRRSWVHTPSLILIC